MSDSFEIRNVARVFVSHPDDAPSGAEVFLNDVSDEVNKFYYEVPIDDLADNIQEKQVEVEYDGRRGTFDLLTKEIAFEDEIRKYKIYISEADSYEEAVTLAPSYADVQETENGAFYYEKLPGQERDSDGEPNYDIGDYDVDTAFGKILADSVNTNDVGKIPVDDFYEYLGEINDDQLIIDCYREEVQGKDRKSGLQFIERRAKQMGIDLDEEMKDAGPDISNPEVVSLIDAPVDIENLPDEVFDSPYTNDMTYRDYYQAFAIDTDEPTEHDLMFGSFAQLGAELPPEYALRVYSNMLESDLSYMYTRRLREAVEDEHGINLDVEMVPSAYRFDLANDYELGTKEFHIAERLESGNELFDWGAKYIDEIEDEVFVEKVKNFVDHYPRDVHKNAVNRINEQWNRLKPPDWDVYDLDPEVGVMIHDAKYPEVDALNGRNIGTGVEDSLEEVYNKTSTEDLEKYLKLAEDRELLNRDRVIRGMLHYRKDSGKRAKDLWKVKDTTNGKYGEDMIDRTIEAAEDTLDMMAPYVGAQLAAYIQDFEIQEPSANSNWVGQSQMGGHRMAIDNPANVRSTTAHEMGHAFHNLNGINSNGYGTIDNRNVNDRDKWRFGAKVSHDANERAKEFYNAVREEWDRYVEEDELAREIRPYQKRHGAEMFAVAMEYWMDDEYKIRNRHPALARAFDEYAGEGEKDIIDPIPHSEIEEGMVVRNRDERGEDSFYRITGIRDTSDGVWYQYEDVYSSETGTMSAERLAVTGIVDTDKYGDVEEGQRYTMADGSTVVIGDMISYNSFWLEDEEGERIDIYDTRNLYEQLPMQRGDD